MNWRKLLLPLSMFWWIGTEVRNSFYNAGLFPSKKFNKAIIIVGNLSVGGTGKSPHVIYLLDLLRHQFNVVALSRGYGRKTSGIRVANYDSTAGEIGDEPMQFFNRFKNRILVAVGEDRVETIEYLNSNYQVDAVILDDAYQHRKLKSDMKILLTSYNDRYSTDCLLPAGNLREAKKNAKRAQIVIVTKCPEFPDLDEQISIHRELKIKPKQHLFFSKVVYSEIIEHRKYPMKLADAKHYNILAITGIANPQPFIDYLNANFNQVRELRFPDHYNFKPSDIQHIADAFKEIEGEKLILTTEKDYMRLRHEYMIVDNLYYLPISILIDRSEEFNQIILNYVQRFQTSY
ncbi:MAG: tetraacyldisaccharide 4'-kinase [Flavobacteriaceae bacterium]|nr:tetraacyldisaccharide 4'-kinase [Flavobacteriaceae bacterium]